MTDVITLIFVAILSLAFFVAKIALIVWIVMLLVGCSPEEACKKQTKMSYNACMVKYGG